MQTRVFLAAASLALCLSGCRKSASDTSTQDGLFHSANLAPYELVLTYDDGPDTHTLDIARFLASRRISATFFVNGCRIAGPTPGLPVTNCTGPRVSEDVLPQLVALGHRLGNHSQDHQSMPSEDPALLTSQLFATQDILDRYINDGIYLFRPPYVSWSAGNAQTLKTHRVLRRLLGPIGFDIDGGDWTCWRDHRSVEDCGRTYLAAIADRPQHNGIVLLHDRPEFAPGSPRPLQLTRWLVHALEDQGYRFVDIATVPHFPQPTFFLVTKWSSGEDFSDAQGFANDPSRYLSVHFGDVNGDGLADVCGRFPEGIRCALSTGTEFTAAWTWLDTEFGDDRGWSAPELGGTVQLADVNGDGRADVCGRSRAGIVCALARADGAGFDPARLWSSGSDFGDADGFNSLDRASTIQFADVNGDGKADVCARAPQGIVCALSDGERFGQKTMWLDEEFGDATGWAQSRYSTSVRLGDIDGDGRADVCGRGNGGVVCALANQAGTAFEAPSFWSQGRDFADDTGWSDTGDGHRAFRLVDLNGVSRADVCARGPTGIVCAESTGASFARAGLRLRGDFTDDQGWNKADMGSTVQLADVDGDRKVDVCGRSRDGIVCALSP